eukprot:6377760-Amphidinium_carterae.1
MPGTSTKDVPVPIPSSGAQPTNGLTAGAVGRTPSGIGMNTVGKMTSSAGTAQRQRGAAGARQSA